MSAKTAAIVAGAGRGERIKAKESKQFMDLAGIPVLARSLLNLQAVPEVDQIILVVNAEDLGRARTDIVENYNLSKVTDIIEGGEWRQESVYNALRVLSSSVESILVHDGARPLATPELFSRSIHVLGDCDCEGVITAVKVVDTVKEVEGGWVIRTPERRRLWAVQTPQCFRSFALMDAHEKANQEGVWATDDAALLERYRYRIRVVEGESSNLKITFPRDFVLAEALLKEGGIKVAVPGRPGL